jgi:hypothetical protein
MKEKSKQEGSFAMQRKCLSPKLRKTTTVKLLAVIAMSMTIPQPSAWASSGQAPFWVYDSAGAIFLARMSQKAEQDDYDGATSGPVRSKLEVYKIAGEKIPKNPTFITSAVCESKREPPEYLNCTGRSGPFSGAKYKAFSTYGVSQPKGNVKLKLLSGQDNPDARKRMISLIKEYAKTKDFRESWGFFAFTTFFCSAGCNTQETPSFIVEINLMGS